MLHLTSSYIYQYHLNILNTKIISHAHHCPHLLKGMNDLLAFPGQTSQVRTVRQKFPNSWRSEKSHVCPQWVLALPVSLLRQGLQQTQPPEEPHDDAQR